MWVREGIAEWVGYHPNDFEDWPHSVNVFILSAASEATRLPITGTFNIDPGVSYALSHAAVTYLVRARGLGRLKAMMTAYRKQYDGVNVDALTARLLTRFYGFGEGRLVVGAQQLLLATLPD
jgi:hypothetical protein